MLYPIFGRCSDTDCNVRRCVFKVINDGKRPLQRLFSQDKLGLYGARSNTAAVGKAQYSVLSVRITILNTVLLFEVFDVDQVRSTIHNWDHKTDLQPESGCNPNHVAVDETVIT